LIIKLPQIKLDQLRTLTDNTGILQHSKFSIPNRKEGYATDDNARALVALLKYHKYFKETNTQDLIKTYMSFLFHMQKPDGRLHNFLDYSLKSYNDKLSDSHGRALWACGYMLNSDIEVGTRRLAKEVFDKGLKWSLKSSSPRIKAFSIMGLHYYKQSFPEDLNIISNLKLLARQLIEAYHTYHSPRWRWFENYLTYSNSRLPQALFLAYQSSGIREFLDVARESIDFLIDVQMIDGVFVPIGNNGWYKKGGDKALYDQQPIEAGSMIEAASSALSVTGDDKYVNVSSTIFDWFFGKNLKRTVLYDDSTGGCFDGINPEGLNLNQGAESTLAYLLARLEMEEIQNFKSSSTVISI
jgi:hypothetical protein